MVAPMVIDGPIDGPAFVAYVEQCLAPMLKCNDIVVMDNLPVLAPVLDDSRRRFRPGAVASEEAEGRHQHHSITRHGLCPYRVSRFTGRQGHVGNNAIPQNRSLGIYTKADAKIPASIIGYLRRECYTTERNSCRT
jgi:hypothetical protein